jgi:hypothetical protein
MAGNLSLNHHIGGVFQNQKGLCDSDASSYQSNLPQNRRLTVSFSGDIQITGDSTSQHFD